MTDFPSSPVTETLPHGVQPMATAPMDGREILGYWSGGKTWEIVYCSNLNERWCNEQGELITPPTHWHPLPSDHAQTPDHQDVRWAVNVLLEKIAEKFEGWETMDLWRSDAATTVRSFKHALSDTSTDRHCEFCHVPMATVDCCDSEFESKGCPHMAIPSTGRQSGPTPGFRLIEEPCEHHHCEFPSCGCEVPISSPEGSSK